MGTPIRSIPDELSRSLPPPPPGVFSDGPGPPPPGVLGRGHEVFRPSPQHVPRGMPQGEQFTVPQNGSMMHTGVGGNGVTPPPGGRPRGFQRDTRRGGRGFGRRGGPRIRGGAGRGGSRRPDQFFKRSFLEDPWSELRKGQAKSESGTMSTRTRSDFFKQSFLEDPWLELREPMETHSAQNSEC